MSFDKYPGIWIWHDPQRRQALPRVVAGILDMPAVHPTACANMQCMVPKLQACSYLFLQVAIG
jgi:hypothetical protein